MSRYIKYIVIALAIVLVVLFAFLVHDYLDLHHAHLINEREIFLLTALRSRGPVTSSDIAFVRPWMTFGYINTLFGLTPDYLETKLSISDPSYPNVPIGTYASRNHIDATTFLGQVVAALQDRFATTTTPSATP